MEQAIFSGGRGIDSFSGDASRQVSASVAIVSGMRIDRTVSRSCGAMSDSTKVDACRDRDLKKQVAKGTVATECGSGVSCIVVSEYGTRVGGVLYIMEQMWEQCCLRAPS